MTLRSILVAGACACTGGGQMAPPAIADLELVAHTEVPDTTLILEPIPFRFTVTNHGPDPAEGVLFAHSVPDSALGDITAPDASCRHMNSSIACDLDVVQVGESREIAVEGFAKSTLGFYTMTTTLSSNSVDPEPLDNTVVDTSTAVGQAALSVRFPSEPFNFPLGTQGFFELEIVNAGPTLAQDAEIIIEHIGPGTVLVDQANTPEFLCNNDISRCTRPFLFPMTTTITIGTVAQTAGQFQMRATITSKSVDDSLADNTTTLTAVIN
jgi:hypothetical protein